MSILPTLTLGPSFSAKRNRQAGGRDLAKHGLDFGELAAALGEVLLEHDPRSLNLARIVHGLHAEADLALLEAVEDLGNRDRLEPCVGDRAHNLPLGEHEAHDLPGLARARSPCGCRRTARCSRGHEVARRASSSILSPLFEKMRGPQGVLRDAPGAAELDGLDHVLRARRRGSLGGWFRRLKRGGRLLAGGGFGRLGLGRGGSGRWGDRFERVPSPVGASAAARGPPLSQSIGTPTPAAGPAACPTSSEPGSFPLCAYQKTHPDRLAFQE